MGDAPINKEDERTYRKMEEKKERVYSFANAYSAYVSKNGRYLNLQIIKALDDGREEMLTCPILLGNGDKKNITAKLDALGGATIRINELYVPKTAGKDFKPKTQAEYLKADDIPF